MIMIINQMISVQKIYENSGKIVVNIMNKGWFAKDLCYFKIIFTKLLGLFALLINNFLFSKNVLF